MRTRIPLAEQEPLAERIVRIERELRATGSVRRSLDLRHHRRHAADLGLADDPAGELRVDGGMIRNELLMQFQADVLGRPVVAPPIAETSALGAAYAAGLAVGFWSGLDELRSMDRAAQRWEPSMPEPERQAGIAIEPIEDEALAQRRFRICLVSARAGDRGRRMRQHGTRLDEDELGGDRHEHADVAETVARQPRQRFEVGAGKVTQADRQHVKLPLLDERQEQSQRAVEVIEVDQRGHLGTALARTGGSPEFPGSLPRGGGRVVGGVGRVDAGDVGAAAGT